MKSLYLYKLFLIFAFEKLNQMLHIDDIRKRLKENPEPKEVTEVRELILNTFNKLEFVEEGHKYFLPNKNGGKDELISVSKMVEQFSPYKNWDAQAEISAAKRGITKEQIQREWKENNIRATNSGTGVHRFGEMYQYFFMGQPELIDDVTKPQYEDGFLIPHSPKEMAAAKLYEDIFKVNNFYPVLAETRVYMGINDKFPIKQKYAGTFDMLFAFFDEKKKLKLSILDWKTNSSLTNSYVRDTDQMMMEPFDMYHDDSINHYMVQLSAYELCLRQLDLDIADRKLIWLKEDGNYEKVSLPSVSDVLANIL